MKPAGVASGFLRIMLRMIADFLIVQTAMLAALIVVALQFQTGSESSVRVGLAELRHYYLTLFLPLSLLFPGFYALSGMYTTSRTYSTALALRRARRPRLAAAAVFTQETALVLALFALCAIGAAVWFYRETLD